MIVKSEGVKNVDSIHEKSISLHTDSQSSSENSLSNAVLTATTTVAQSTSVTTVTDAQEGSALGKRVRKSTSKFEEYEQTIVSDMW